MASRRTRSPSGIRQIFDHQSRLHTTIQTWETCCHVHWDTAGSHTVRTCVHCYQDYFHQEVTGSTRGIDCQTARARCDGHLEITCCHGPCANPLRLLHDDSYLVDIPKSSTRLRTGMVSALDGGHLWLHLLPSNHVCCSQDWRDRHGHCEVSSTTRPITHS